MKKNLKEILLATLSLAEEKRFYSLLKKFDYAYSRKIFEYEYYAVKCISLLIRGPPVFKS